MKISTVLHIFFIVLFLSVINQEIIPQDKNRSILDTNAHASCLDTLYVVGEKLNFEREMRKRAITDIAEGNVYLPVYGLIVWTIDKTKLDSLTRKYGFEYSMGGCVIPAGTEAYKDEVMKYLNERNGEGWWAKFEEEKEKIPEIFHEELKKNEE